MRKLISFLVISVMLVGMLAGCNQPAASSTGGTTTTVSQTTSATTTATPAAGAPEYINMESDLPIIKDGYDVSLSFAVLHSADYGQIEDLHFWNFVKEKMNINYKVEQIFNRDEYVNLAFASDTLSDVLIGFNVNPIMQMNYGVSEGQLLPLSKYINHEYMPNLQTIYDDYPEYRASVTAPDGEIYSFGVFWDPANPSTFPKRQINTKWLNELGLEYPKTLDEFIDVLDAFKTMGDNIIPIAGSFSSMNPFYMILNAFGYITNDSTGKSAAVRNEKAVIPAGDREVFGTVLMLLNDFYNKGYISRDFYTLDDVATKAIVSELRNGVINADAFVPLPSQDEYSQYECFPPITSEYCSEPFVLQNSVITTGGYVISSKCDEPEAAIRFANYCLSDEGSNMTWVGAVRGSENLLEGWGGWYLDENYSRLDVDRMENPDKWPNAVEYLRKRVAGFNMGAINNVINEFTWRPQANGLEPRNMYDVWRASPNNGDFWWRPSAVDYVMPYATTGFPTIVFFTREQNERVTELSSVINAHIDAECAKFVTGARAVSDTELNKYFDELDALGFQEYLDFYEAAYANYIENLA